MIKISNDDVLTLSLSIPAALVDQLAMTVTSNFMAEQPGRFLPLHDGLLPSPDAPEFRDGTLMWTDCASDAFLLRACEQAAGEDVTLLVDEFGDIGSGLVVLSSRPFDR